jgi:hypothetical protein
MIPWPAWLGMTLSQMRLTHALANERLRARGPCGYPTRARPEGVLRFRARRRGCALSRSPAPRRSRGALSIQSTAAEPALRDPHVRAKARRVRAPARAQRSEHGRTAHHRPPTGEQACSRRNASSRPRKRPRESNPHGLLASETPRDGNVAGRFCVWGAVPASSRWPATRVASAAPFRGWRFVRGPVRIRTHSCGSRGGRARTNI